MTGRHDGHGHGHGHDHDHRHGHDHDHDHGHDHDHDHDHGDPEARDELARGVGAGKLLFLDAFSGIAGDMTIAALVHLGVPFEVVRGAVAALGLSGVTVAIRGTWAGAIGAARFDVEVASVDGERSYAEIAALIAAAPLLPGVAELAQRIFRRLAQAESEVHAIPIEDVHFHEVGAADALADVVGAAACFEHLGAEVASSPLPIGRGMVSSRHGPLPLPAPATLLCLRGAPTYDAGIDGELVTPTGAAIIGTVARRFLRWPSLSPERVGWGAGTRRLPDRPNALRAVLGLELGDEARELRPHVVIEANVDDMTGEIAAHVLEALLGAGALDAWAAPITMKKGRPALTVFALAERADADRVTQVLLTESSSIGARRHEVSRTERPRRSIEVATRFGPIPVKISEGPYGPAQVKPEFDACARAAKAAGVPVREVITAALAAARL